MIEAGVRAGQAVRMVANPADAQWRLQACASLERFCTSMLERKVQTQGCESHLVGGQQQVVEAGVRSGQAVRVASVATDA